MALTQKRKDEAYEAMRQRLSQKLRELYEPPSLASRLYPHLPRSTAPEQPKRGMFQGWSHLSRQQKEK